MKKVITSEGVPIKLWLDGMEEGALVQARNLAIMDRQGILHGISAAEDLDEAPGAYKDIGEVMENQKDLVKIRVELRPLAVVKG